MAVQMRYGDYVKGGWDIIKANLVMSIVCTLLISIVGSIPLVGLVSPILMVNFMAAIKAAKHEGKPIEVGALFNFDNAVDKWVGPFIVGVLAVLGSLCVIGGIVVAGLFFFVTPILADKPGTPFMSAIKGALAFGKQNFVPSLIMAIVCGLVMFVGVLACGFGTLVTLPVAMAAHYLAYEDHKSAIESAAAAEGVQL